MKTFSSLFEKNMSFEEIVMCLSRCAFPQMRDLHGDLPDEFKPDISYYEEELLKSQMERSFLTYSSDSELKKRYESEAKAKIQSITEKIEKAKSISKKYDWLMQKLDSWKVTKDLRDLKDYIVFEARAEMLSESDFYFLANEIVEIENSVKNFDATKYRRESLDDAMDDIEQYERDILTETKSAEEANTVLRNLRESLKNVK